MHFDPNDKDFVPRETRGTPNDSSSPTAATQSTEPQDETTRGSSLERMVRRCGELERDTEPKENLTRAYQASQLRLVDHVVESKRCLRRLISLVSRRQLNSGGAGK